MPAVNGGDVRRRRQRTGLKLGPFCKRYKVNYQTLANIESKNQPASLEFLHRLAGVLGCEAEDLLADEPNGACLNEIPGTEKAA
jgi:transcriptional regulator with XRE-family HTH domain